MKITTNTKKALEVCTKAIGMLESKVYPFNQPDLFPDALPPEGVERGSLEHAAYLFYSVSLDIGRESKGVYRRAKQLYKAMNFLDVPQLPAQEVERAIHANFEAPSTEGKEKGKLWADPVKMFICNGEKLNREYENDPRNIKRETVEETLREIRNFRNYGRTNNALFLKNMVKAGIWTFPENGFPIKIDRHVIKISLGTGVIRVRGAEELRFEKLVKPLDDVYKKVMKREDLSAIQLSDAFWAIGRYLCVSNNAIGCATSCDIGCETRARTDKRFTTIKLKEETREDMVNLFNWNE